jgi:hypothetical protein
MFCRQITVYSFITPTNAYMIHKKFLYYPTCFGVIYAIFTVFYTKVSNLVKYNTLQSNWYHITAFRQLMSTFVFNGVTARRGSRSYSDKPHSVGLLWTSDQLDHLTPLCEYTEAIIPHKKCTR